MAHYYHFPLQLTRSTTEVDTSKTIFIDSIINTIEEYGGKGINFIYTSCRLERGSDSIGPQSGSIIDGSRGLDGGVSQ